MIDELMTPDEVAERFRVSRALVYRAIKSGDLPASPQPYLVTLADATRWRAPIIRDEQPKQKLPKGRRRKQYAGLGANRGKL